MTGFSPGWLALRSAADAAARDNDATAALRRLSRDGDALLIADLGCGTGANLRFLAPRLGGRQHWRLYDSDKRLLWRLAAQPTPPNTTVEAARCDLAVPDARPDLADVDLVTGSALLDLVDGGFVDWLAGIAAAGVALHFALSYDGRMSWGAPHPADGRIRDLFNRHQRGDKGFGPALGPDAWRVAAERFAASGAETLVATSDWVLGPAARALHLALLDGIAAAAVEIAPEAADEVQAWRAARMASVDAGMVVGHRCVTALPRG